MFFLYKKKSWQLFFFYIKKIKKILNKVEHACHGETCRNHPKASLEVWRRAATPKMRQNANLLVKASPSVSEMFNISEELLYRRHRGSIGANDLFGLARACVRPAVLPKLEMLPQGIGRHLCSP